MSLRSCLATAVYDNPETQRREYYFVNLASAFNEPEMVQSETMAHYLEGVNPECAIPWEDRQVIGDPRALPQALMERYIER